MRIKSLFRQKKSSALEKLQAALEQNHLDENWLQSLRTEAERLAADRKAALERFSNDASEQTASTFLECDARYRSHKDSLLEAHQAGHRSVLARCFERTQAPLKAALLAAVDEIHAEIARIAAADDSAAASLGLSPSEVESPIRRTLAQTAARAQQYLSECEKATEMGSLKNGLSFLSA